MRQRTESRNVCDFGNIVLSFANQLCLTIQLVGFEKHIRILACKSFYLVNIEPPSSESAALIDPDAVLPAGARINLLLVQ
jgi:hypothetical protein